MSRPSLYCPLRLYFLLLLMLPMALSPEAFSGGPRDAGRMARGCLSLKIGHSNNTLLLGQKPIPEVKAKLLNASTHQTVDCYTPGANHLVQLAVHGTDHKIKGLAISVTKTCGRLGVKTDTLGRFSPESPLRWWLTCPNTVTQNSVLGKGAGVKEVAIPWKAPSMSSQSATFVYSVVFSQYEWLDELRDTFPSCVPPCVTVALDNTTNSSAAADNSTLDDWWEPASVECRPSFASESLVRCGALPSFPKMCSVLRGSFVIAQNSRRFRTFVRDHHPQATLNCTRIDCNC